MSGSRGRRSEAGDRRSACLSTRRSSPMSSASSPTELTKPLNNKVLSVLSGLWLRNNDRKTTPLRGATDEREVRMAAVRQAAAHRAARRLPLLRADPPAHLPEAPLAHWTAERHLQALPRRVLR